MTCAFKRFSGGEILTDSFGDMFKVPKKKLLRAPDRVLCSRDNKPRLNYSFSFSQERDF